MHLGTGGRGRGKSLRNDGQSETPPPFPSQMVSAVAQLGKAEEEVDALHAQLEARGVNSRGTQDVFGRKFAVPVDGEHKSLCLGPVLFGRGMLKQPHMRAFWAATFGFFCTFFAVFAPAALITWIKESQAQGGLGLTAEELSTAGAAAVGTTVGMRFLTGPLCDKYGARKTMAFLLLTALPGLVVLATAQGADQFTAGRALIGLSLASFVTCQVWCSQMFTKSIVGTVNATAGGWGNLGGGVTLLVMPMVMEGMLQLTGDDRNGQDKAWRLCMLVPGCLCLVATLAVITGRDLPDGNYRELERSGAKQKGSGAKTFAIAASNLNTWWLMIGYAFCFGVELTMNNKSVIYFYEYYDVSKSLAGVLGACFGLMNLFARSWGGMLSDAAMAKFGLRGRLWAYWVVQVAEGFMCLALGLSTVYTPSPSRMRCSPECYTECTDPIFTSRSGDFCVPKYSTDPYAFGDHVTPGDGQNGMFGQYQNEIKYLTRTETVLYTIISNAAWIKPCASTSIDNPGVGCTNFNATSGLCMSALEELPTDLKKVVVGDYGNDECVRNSGKLVETMVIIVFFSIFVQMAEGLTYGIVPYVSRPALGGVAGMVGAGGNLGAVIGSKAIIANSDYDQGFVVLGMVVLCTSLLFHLLYFPEAGGTLLKKGALGSFSPQLWMPQGDDRGADQLDYSAAEAPSVSRTTSLAPPQSGEDCSEAENGRDVATRM